MPWYNLILYHRMSKSLPTLVFFKDLVLLLDNNSSSSFECLAHILWYDILSTTVVLIVLYNSSGVTSLSNASSTHALRFSSA